jgi:hypothetical protein
MFILQGRRQDLVVLNTLKFGSTVVLTVKSCWFSFAATYENVSRKIWRKRSLRKLSRRLEHDNKVAPNEIVSNNSSWINLAQTVNHWNILVKKITIRWVLKGRVEYFTSWMTKSVSNENFHSWNYSIYRRVRYSNHCHDNLVSVLHLESIVPLTYFVWGKTSDLIGYLKSLCTWYVLLK